jgi:hypothetical protein
MLLHLQCFDTFRMGKQIHNQARSDLVQKTHTETMTRFRYAKKSVSALPHTVMSALLVQREADMHCRELALGPRGYGHVDIAILICRLEDALRPEP